MTIGWTLDNTFGNTSNHNDCGFCDSTYGSGNTPNHLGLGSNSWALVFRADNGVNTGTVQAFVNAQTNNTNQADVSLPITADQTSVSYVAMMAADLNNHKVWMGVNGTWLYGGDPTSGANPTFSNGAGNFPTSGTFYPAATISLPNGSSAIVEGHVIYNDGFPIYIPPGGFTYLPKKFNTVGDETLKKFSETGKTFVGPHYNKWYSWVKKGH